MTDSFDLIYPVNYLMFMISYIDKRTHLLIRSHSVNVGKNQLSN